MPTALAIIGLLVTALALLTKWIEMQTAAMKLHEEIRKGQATSPTVAVSTPAPQPVQSRRSINRFQKIDILFGFGFSTIVLIYLYGTRQQPMTKFDVLLAILAATNYAVSYVDLKRSRTDN